MILARRSFLQGLAASLFVAPSIVRASSLMPIKEYAPYVPDWCPAGWLPMDGREITKKFYPDLYASLERLRWPKQLPVQNLETAGRVRNIISARDLMRANGEPMKAGAQFTLILPEGSA